MLATTNVLSSFTIPPQCLGYQLPADWQSSEMILPVSGGADSSYLAILLHALFPHVPFRMVFTDTLAEDDGVLLSLDRLEAYIGRPIERLVPEMGLFDLIDHWGGHLPSSTARWCTRALKARPFEAWLKQFEGLNKYIFVGIRSDEAQRVAFVLDGAETLMPFVDMGLDRSAIFEGLSSTVGIPRFYTRRTRSGCSVCPFQRRGELVGLLQEQPVEFHRGRSYERLSQEDSLRHRPAPSLIEETGITVNHFSLPLPEGEEIRGSAAHARLDDLFGNRGVFVGIEYFYDSFCGVLPFTWHRRVVSYSPTYAGIKRQLDDRYAHMLDTAEVFDMTPADVRRDVKFGVFYLQAPSEVFDPEGPSTDSFTWQKGNSYAQTAHVVGWAQRILTGHFMQKEAGLVDSVPATSRAYEVGMGSRAAMERVKQPIGEVVSSAWYRAKEPSLEEQLDERFITCPACSI